jgi:hypothetical protein
MYAHDEKDYPMDSRAMSKTPGLTLALDDQEKAVEALRALAGDLVARLGPILRPARTEAELMAHPEAVPDWSPAVERVRGVERQITGIQRTLSDALGRLDA